MKQGLVGSKSGTAGLAVAACITLLSLVACSSTPDDASTSGSGLDDIEIESSGDPVDGGQLTTGLAAETSGWKPAVDQWASPGYTVANALFDPLMAYDAEYTPRPYLLESLDHNEDFTEWTLTMREGIRFHNDEPADAGALVANMEALRTSVLAGSAFSRIAQMTEVDDLTVRLTMSEPWSTFPHQLTTQAGYLAAPEMLADPDGSSKPIGTGPFVLDEWVRDSRLTASKNPDYWQEGLPYLDAVEFVVLPDPASRLNALTTGDVDVVTFASQDAQQIDDAAAEAEDGDLQLYVDEDGETTETFILLNTSTPPFDEPVCRQALATGIDTALISETVFGGLAPPAAGISQPGSPWYTEAEYPAYEPEEAQQLVDECKELNGGEFAFEALLPPDANALAAAQLIQQQGKDLGVDAELVTVEQTAHIVRTLTKDYQASAFRIPFFTHPDLLSSFVSSDGITPTGEFGLNATQLENPEIDDALRAARETDDVETQSEHYADVQRSMNDDLARIWIVHDIEAVVTSADVRGLTSWTLPDDTPALGQTASVFFATHAWRDRS